MSSRKRRAQLRKLKAKIPTVTLKELQEAGEVPEYLHLFSASEMKEYHDKINKERRDAFRKRLDKYDFIDSNDW